MEFPITEKFKKFKQYLESSNIEDVKSLTSKFVEAEEDLTIDDIVNSVSRRLSKKGFVDPKEKYGDILTINQFHFHAWLEIDGFSTQIEFNIEKLLTRLFITEDYDSGLSLKGQSPGEIALWKTFRVFDTRPEVGDGKMAVFSIQEGVSPPNEPAIYYIDRASCWKTNLTFVQYYEAVLDMMGIADWQLLFTDVSMKDPMLDHYYSGLKESLEALAKAFSDKDYSKYFELLEARWV